MSISKINFESLESRPYDIVTSHLPTSFKNTVNLKEYHASDGFIAGQVPYTVTMDGIGTSNAEIFVTERFTRALVAKTRPEEDGSYIVEGLDITQLYDVTARDLNAVYEDITVQNVRPKRRDEGIYIVEHESRGLYRPKNVETKWSVFNVNGTLSVTSNVPDTIITFDGRILSAKHETHTGEIKLTLSDSSDSTQVKFTVGPKSKKWRIGYKCYYNIIDSEGVELFQNNVIVHPIKVVSTHPHSSPQFSDPPDILDFYKIDPGRTFRFSLSGWSQILGIPTHVLEFADEVTITEVFFGCRASSFPDFIRLEYMDEDGYWKEVCWSFSKKRLPWSSQVIKVRFDFVYVDRDEVLADPKKEHILLHRSAMAPSQDFLDYTMLYFNEDQSHNHFFNVQNYLNHYSDFFVTNLLPSTTPPTLRWISEHLRTTYDPIYISFGRNVKINSIHMRHSLDDSDTIKRGPSGFAVLSRVTSNHFILDWETSYMATLEANQTRSWYRNISDITSGNGIAYHVFGNSETSLPKDSLHNIWTKIGTVTFDSIDKPLESASMGFTASSGYITCEADYIGLHGLGSPFAIDGWVKIPEAQTDSPSYRGAVLWGQSMQESNSEMWFGVDLNPAGDTWKPVFVRGSDTARSSNEPEDGGLRLAGNIPVAPDTWTHIACDYDGLTLRIYTNGILCAEADTRTAWPRSCNSVDYGKYTIGKANLSSTTTWIAADFKVAGIRFFQAAAWKGSFNIPTSEYVYPGPIEGVITPPPESDSNQVRTSILNFDNNLSDEGTAPKSWVAFGNAAVSTNRAKFGSSSIRFNGIGDCIRAAPPSVLAGGGGHYTVEGWLWVDNVGQLTSGRVLANFVDSSSPTDETSLYSFGWRGNVSTWSEDQRDRLVYERNWSPTSATSTGLSLSSSVTLPKDQWVHVALTYDGYFLRIFQDGQLVASAETTQGWSSSLITNPSIGGMAGSSVASGFKGNIDAFRVTNGKCLYTENFIPPTEPPVGDIISPPSAGDLHSKIIESSPWAYYKMSDTNLPVTDYSLNNRHLDEKKMTPEFGVPGLYDGSDTAIKFARTDTATGSAVCSYANAYGTDIEAAFDGDKAWSISAVVKLDALGGILVHIGNFQVFGSQGFFMSTGTSGEIGCGGFTTASWQSVSSPGVLMENESAILHVTRDPSGTVTLYKNGVSVGSGVLNTVRCASTSSAGGMRISIGSATSGGGTSDASAATIQSVAIYNKVLDPLAILEQATAAGFT